MESDSNIDIFVTFSPLAITVGLFYADWLAQKPTVFEAFYNLNSLVVSSIPLTNGTIGSLTSSLAASSAPYNAR